MFNKITLEIWRLTTVSGDKQNYQNTGEKIIGTLEPMDVEFAAIAETAFGKTYKLYSKNLSSTITETDRLKKGVEEYEVKGVQKYNHLPKHVQVILEKVIKQ